MEKYCFTISLLAHKVTWSDIEQLRWVYDKPDFDAVGKKSQNLRDTKLQVVGCWDSLWTIGNGWLKNNHCGSLHCEGGLGRTRDVSFTLKLPSQSTLQRECKNGRLGSNLRAFRIGKKENCASNFNINVVLLYTSLNIKEAWVATWNIQTKLSIARQ